MATPIFIVGTQRSGTSWLANQLSFHSKISSVSVGKDNQYNLNPGIYESYFFSHLYNRYGDISHKPSFIELLEIINSMDYFKIIGINKDELYSLWPISYEGIYRYIMDQFATKNNAIYWLDKTPQHTPLMSQIASFYPDAIFIGIRRDLIDVAKSSFKMYLDGRDTNKSKKAKRKQIRKIVYGWVYYNKTIDSFFRKFPKSILLDYNLMRDDLEAQIKMVCDFLRIDFDNHLTASFIPSNTSFKSNSLRSTIFSSSDIKLIKSYQSFYQRLPLLYFNSKKLIPNKYRNRNRLLFVFAMSYPYTRNIFSND